MAVWGVDMDKGAVQAGHLICKDRIAIDENKRQQAYFQRNIPSLLSMSQKQKTVLSLWCNEPTVLKTKPTVRRNSHLGYSV